jgi:hypothetical protein
MLVLEELKVNVLKKRQHIYINTLIPSFSYKDKNGKLVNLKNCCIKM